MNDIERNYDIPESENSVQEFALSLLLDTTFDKIVRYTGAKYMYSTKNGTTDTPEKGMNEVNFFRSKLPELISAYQVYLETMHVLEIAGKDGESLEQYKILSDNPFNRLGYW